MDGRLMSLGMIETYGLPALIAAADAAAKTADVKVTTYEKVDAGIVTIYILGDVAAVKAAVDAGAAEAKRVGKLLSTHVIPRPDPSVHAMIQEAWAKNQPKDSPKEERNKVITTPEVSAPNWSKMSVAQLRELAHNTPRFPITGRDIQLVSKAELVRLFTGMDAEGGDPVT
ncbi:MULTISPECIES: BMC domain-containing protein [unclassified Paenibacillus]|uniref:BMC domain-containing protein n=1 Tax=unclassified Paenibacillus TaxID=185978 RepID=UPI002784C81F|nr:MULTISPECIES: BMC domain-containing protein [unclassified Paenibacillus]MDQ0902267.1 microcompartment protein CcmL/EutN [Paenibacillus sp. V4I7]MDQ0919236.1 microcompartment protein CcmL/EutN [Paenibacillus sp. V4I5]